MLQEDYFIRLIEEFTAAISKFLTKKKDEDKMDSDMKDLYRQYLGPFDVVRNLSFDELLGYVKENYRENQFMERLNFAAELLYAEASYKNNPLRAMLLEKTYKLYAYLDANSGVMSFDRNMKMSSIRTELNK